jgi:hypothetical protein
MWLYSGPSCPDRPFSEELGEAEVNTQFYKVLAYEADPNREVRPTLLGEGVNSTRVSPFTFAFDSLCDLTHS